MNHPLLAASAALVCLGAAGAAAAAVSLTQVTTVDGAETMVNRLMFDGESAKIVLLESATPNPFMPVGSYLLMTDGMVYLVNPAQRTFARFDAEGLASGAAAMAGAMQITDVKVEKVIDEAGETIAGFPTRHYQFKSSWTMSVAGMPVKTEMATVEDIWATDAIDVPEGIDLGSLALPGGAQALAEASALNQVEGFPLRLVTAEQTKTDMGGALGGLGGRLAQRMASRVAGGAEQGSTTTIETRDIEQGDLPAGTFALPEGYRETSLLQTGPALPQLNRVPEGRGIPNLNDLEEN